MFGCTIIKSFLYAWFFFIPVYIYFFLTLSSIFVIVLFLWHFAAATVQFPLGDHESFIRTHLVLLSFPSKNLPHSFCFARSRAAVQCRFRGCTRCALRSSHDAGFLPDKAQGFGWKTRWSSGGILFLCYNGVQQSEMWDCSVRAGLFVDATCSDRRRQLQLCRTGE